MVYKQQNKKGKAKKNKTTEENKGSITVKEAGRRGGNTTKARYGPGYYEAIGKKGGQKVRQLIAAGKKAMANN
jgi:general stress protein YciG